MRLLPLVGLALCLAAGPVLAGGLPQPSSATRFAGHYRHAGGEAETNALARLVERTVQAFTPLLRPIARRRLEKTVVVPERIEIEDATGTLSLRAVGAPDLPDAPRLEAGEIVVRQSNFEGSRRTSFRLAPDGRTLWMHVETSSALLPDDLEYQLTFQRDEAALAGPLPSHESPPSTPTAEPAPVSAPPEPGNDAGS